MEEEEKREHTEQPVDELEPSAADGSLDPSAAELERWADDGGPEPEYGGEA